MERIKSGIPGLDELIEGGFPVGSTTLLSGGTGTCKTIFSMQYIYNGAKLYNEPGLFVTIEANPKNIAWNMQSFGWDIGQLQEEGRINIYRMHLAPKKTFGDLVKDELVTITGIVKELGIKRIAVDSTTAFASLIDDPSTIRSILLKFAEALKEMNCTTSFTSE